MAIRCSTPREVGENVASGNSQARGEMEEQQPHVPQEAESDCEADAIDLNRVFGESELDLNAMFPDREMRKFLAQVKRNRRSNQRFIESVRQEKITGEDG
ncbi:MAG: hypothetical protein JRJ12_14690 [Deltaproteobacteria bacterium]|nr:hypothetical protein [Deltaproteobacteria bacterium]MBW2070855.1 hypothetical protein [Deltaproteobacteria bacterium]